MSKRINNHLRDGYSKFNLLFLKRYIQELNKKSKILDVGTGHYRNLKLFNEIGFNNLFAIDKNIPDPIHKIDVDLKIKNIENGLPYDTQKFDVVLCNFVLMFIDPLKINFVLDELMRVTNKFLVIETMPMMKGTKETEYKDYNFNEICKYIASNEDFEILQKRNYYEKLLIRRVQHGEG